jgi:predicted transcriptional regulator
VFAEKIFSGEKKYEFRRVMFKNRQVSTVVVYASSPVQKVVGEFEIEAILTDDIEALWQRTKEYSGISEEFFFRYFADKSRGHAIQIKKVKRYRKPLCLNADFAVAPPQSFLYLL